MTEKQVEANVEEKVEDSEPTPYKNDYHKDLDKEDPQPDPEAVEAEATQKENEEDKSFLSTSNDKEVKTHDFKKRYDDLKKHYDTKLDEWKQEKETLEAQSKAAKADTDYKPPKTPEELEQFKEDYPDIYGVVETIAHKQAGDKLRTVEEKLAKMSDREEELIRDKAQTELLSVHPDFLEIKGDENFQGWLQEQPTSISDGILKNGTDSKWAVRVLDLYKADAGISKKTSTARPTLSAAEAVTKTRRVVVPEKAGDKKIWKQSDISKLKPHEFEKLEKEIDLAAKEGRISSG
jgi:hypothetical protein|tara:strand:+ start:328 stop:1203 length:876 start_codon:yes stop_codon:yes gene_type:complete